MGSLANVWVSLNFNVKESKLLSDCQMLKHEVHEGGLQCKTKDGNFQKALANWATFKLFDWVESIVAVQVMHALELYALISLVWEVYESVWQ